MITHTKLYDFSCNRIDAVMDYNYKAYKSALIKIELRSNHDNPSAN